MPTLSETIQLGSNSFVIQQGEYDLASDSMRLRCNIPLTAGCDYLFKFTLVDPAVLDVNGNPTPVDITSDSFKFCVKEKFADVALLANIDGAVIDGPAGRFNIVVPDGTFTNTTLVTGVYEIQQTDSSAGGDICTLIHGCIQILPKICL